MSSNTPKLFGYLPIKKPKGICINKLLTAIKGDLYYTLEKRQISHGLVLVSYPKYLETYACGLTTFVIGSCNLRKRNFTFSDYRYRVTVEFGVQRVFDSVEGEVISSENVDHLDEHRVRSTLASYIGLTLQSILRVKKKKTEYIERESMCKVEDYYNNIIIPFDKPESKMKTQKYPPYVAQREVWCSKIDLIEYNKPYGTFEIECEGRFYVQPFIRDLLRELNIKGSIVELIRLREAVMELDDLRVLDLHEVNCDLYLDRMSTWRHAYERYLERFDTRFDQPKDLRLM